MKIDALFFRVVLLASFFVCAVTLVQILEQAAR